MNSTNTESKPRCADNTAGLFHHFKLNDLELTTLSDGYIEGKAENAACEVDADELLEFLASKGLSTKTNRIPIACLFVRSPKHGNILIDSGLRHLPGPLGTPIPTAGKLPQSLKAAGISPAEIDIVLASHAHPDHIGGLFDENDKPTFPNAKHYISQEEVDFWSQNPSLAGTLMPSGMQQDTIDVAQRYIRLAGKQGLHTFAAGTEPLEGINTILLDGHTPGQVGYLFDTTPRKFLFTGDALGNCYVSVMRPDWRFAFDTNAPLAIATRKRLVALLMENNWLMFTPHFPWPNVGSISSSDNGPMWAPYFD